MQKLYLLALAPLFMTTVHAACVDDVDTLAKKYGVSTTLPKTTDNSATTSDQLAASGGVITPPATGDTATITPVLPNPDAMQTAPAIAPQTAEGDTETHKGTGDRAAAADSQAAAVLMAARQAGMQGQESTCEEGLAKARGLLEK